ncbi:MAG: glycerol-3-phosphate 1-O-acyltransferase PlsY [Eubacterium sp.]|nr:glycerol-3-phosphate 1-O-acyltransferase PlsY [Eubacterium sp.]
MLTRLICLLIGYICGLFQTGYFYGKKKEFDLRSHGSGNTGMTNALRTMGVKAGAIVFIGDVLKCILAVVIVYFLFRNNEQTSIKLLELYAAAGAVLGHDFPFFLGFKGGKGMSCTAGLCLGVYPLITLPAAVIFLVPVIMTKFISLGSIMVSVALPIISAVYIKLGIIDLSGNTATEFVVLMALIGLLNIVRHRANIKRLLTGTENKFREKKEV